MKQAKLVLNKNFIQKEEIDKRMYGSFVEHMGNVIYGGIYDPSYPTANKDGFREDVIQMVRDLGLSVIRYPGGNYVCSYNWEDTVGPVEQRPARIELAWQGIEPNTVGLPEFKKWTDAVGAELIMAVNLSSRGVIDAANIVEYCNFPGGTYYSELRKKHGYEPFHIKTWCVGNEVDGPWNIAARCAEDYAWKAAEAAKAMKRIAGDIELVAVGSSHSRLPTWGEWDRKVLESVYEYCDYISLHHYLGQFVPPDPLSDYLVSNIEMDQQIETIIAVCDYIKGLTKSKKTMYLSFDEYGVVEPSTFSNLWDYHNHEERLWKTGKPLHQNRVQTLKKTLLFGGAIISLLRHSDRVKIACQAVLINSGLVFCDQEHDAWATALYYVLQSASRYGRGHIMHLSYEGPKIKTERYGLVDAVDLVAVYTGDAVNILAVNRTEDTVELGFELQDFETLKAEDHIVLTGDDLNMGNTAENPRCLVPVSRQDIEISGRQCSCNIPAYSWNVLRIKVT